MFMMKASRENGNLVFETLEYSIDESLYLDTPEFLTECANLPDNNDMCFGIVDKDIYDVLLNAYPMR